MSQDESGEPPRKRSKWDVTTHDEDAELAEQIALETKLRAAARASMLKAKKAVQEPPNLPQDPQADPSVEAPREDSQEAAPASLKDALPDIPRKAVARSLAPSRSAHPVIGGCRSVHCYERLNHIEEGSYGVVFRARNKETGEIVALKKLKMDKEKDGFPITSLREIRTLMEARHPNVVQVKEIVVGDTLSQIYIVMEFVEHDLKTLLSNMRTPFLQSEIKTLMLQLLSAVSLLHSNWIVHRDLKTSNLLMNNRGMMKLADFGLARLFGDPLGDMTTLVVTLWYRAPELLLGAKEYDTAIDMWSVGCIFGELMLREPMFMGKNEADQIVKIFKLLGQPTEQSWPGYTKLPEAQQISSVAQPYSALRSRFKYCTDSCLDLLKRLLTYDPAQRITADEALTHPYFNESPAPAHPDSFGSFPSVAAGERKRDPSPTAPQRLADQK
ncbi:hypothetical protein OC842_000874 [Tilletia horrida]|uniref:cyclin-dependent kinase n=1 Tax=Tilletia horrida TaxID=155126 RepID=A0AAN6GIL0_9BASI|nr:hypothetical protein OC842_000874 [Tilletia horrida]